MQVATVLVITKGFQGPATYMARKRIQVDRWLYSSRKCIIRLASPRRESTGPRYAPAVSKMLMRVVRTSDLTNEQTCDFRSICSAKFKNFSNFYVLSTFGEIWQKFDQ